MDIVLGVSMETSAVRMVLIEGASANGLTVEEDSIEVAAPSTTGDGQTDSSGPANQVIAALIGTREGAVESGYHLLSTGVTWTDPAEVGALRAALAAHDAGSVMLVSPLLAAAALAQTVGSALEYEHIAMLFVEVDSATLAVVDIADGSIVDLHRQSLKGASLAAELVTMVAGLDAPRSRADGVFLVGCGVDIVGVKPALDAATSLMISAPEEPELALARGAALASANAPLFASSTSALAYALDPGTGEVNPRALTPSYLDVCAMAGVGEGALAYSAVPDEVEHEVEAEDGADSRSDEARHKPLALVSSALAGVAAVAAGMLMMSLASHVRETAAQQPSVSESRESVETPALAAPATELPAQVLLPVPSSAPAAPPPEPPPAQVAAPPPPVVQPPTRTVTRPAQAPAYLAPAPQRRAPTRQAAPPVQAPEQAPVQAPAPPPAAVPAPAPPAPAAPAAPTPVMTMYLHLPFVSIPIPINPPPPPPPPAEPGP
jgi:hypothetical protein